MSRLFSILVSLFILVLVYLWIGHIVKAGKPKAITNQSVELPEEKTEARDPEIVEAPEEIPSRVEETPQEEVKEAEQQVVKPKTPKPTAAASGGHLVIAGNFLERANA